MHAIRSLASRAKPSAARIHRPVPPAIVDLPSIYLQPALYPPTLDHDTAYLPYSAVGISLYAPAIAGGANVALGAQSIAVSTFAPDVSSGSGARMTAGTYYDSELDATLAGYSAGDDTVGPVPAMGSLSEQILPDHDLLLLYSQDLNGATLLLFAGDFLSEADGMTLAINGVTYPAPEWDSGSDYTAAYWFSGHGPQFVNGATYTVALVPA